MLPTAQLGLQYLLSEEGRFLRQQLVLALTEDDRLHTAEVQRIWNLVKDELKPARLFDAAIGALTTLSRDGTAGFIPAAMLSKIAFQDRHSLNDK